MRRQKVENYHFFIYFLRIMRRYKAYHKTLGLAIFATQIYANLRKSTQVYANI